MNAQIATLVKVQALDQKILKLKRRQIESPKSLAAAEAEVSRRGKLLDQRQTEAKDFEVQIRLKEVDLQDHEARAKKLEEQRYVRGIKNREYQALGHEIEGEKANISYIQDEILEFYTQLEGLRKGAEQLQQEVQTAQAALAEQRKQVEAELRKVQAELDGLETQRRSVTAGIDREILARYDRVMVGKGDAAVVEVLDNICQGCFMSLTPQMVLTLRNSSDVVTCTSCGRMLYLP